VAGSATRAAIALVPINFGDPAYSVRLDAANFYLPRPKNCKTAFVS
jgi:hypothetical protein